LALEGNAIGDQLVQELKPSAGKNGRVRVGSHLQ